MLKRLVLIALCVAVCLAAGCRKADKKVPDEPEYEDVAELVIDREHKETAIEMDKERVVTRAGADGGGEITITDESGEVTHTFQAGEDGNSVTVTDGAGGISTYGTGVNVTSADLGIPFFPRADVTFGQKSAGEARGKAMRAVLATDEPYEKPRDFYSRALPHSAYHHSKETDAGRTDMWTWYADGSQFSVVVQQDSPGGIVNVTLEKMSMR